MHLKEYSQRGVNCPSLAAAFGRSGGGQRASPAAGAGFLYPLLGAMRTIVLGDFNSTSRMQAPLFTSRKGFIDSFASVTEKPDDHPTWKLRSDKLRLALRIDYIFHTKDFTTAKSRVVASEGSDHLLLVSELAWADRKPGQN